jgi:hypothetical protein
MTPRDSQTSARNDRIAVRYMQGESGRALAREYGVSEGRIRQIVNRRFQLTRQFYFDQFGHWPTAILVLSVRAQLRHLFAQVQQAAQAQQDPPPT